MNALDTIKSIQAILHVAEDGIFGPQSMNALSLLVKLPDASPWPQDDEQPFENGPQTVKASSFADPADVRAFRHCKSDGGTDQQCFKVGDNGIGKWGDDCTEGSGPRCALPPEVWSTFGSAARGKKVLVTHGDKSVVCELRDTMPHIANLANAARIDLNPDACAALGLMPPVMADVTWQWA